MTAVTSPSGNRRLVPIPPDGGWGWVVVLGSFFVHVFADGFVYSFGVLVEVLMKEFNSDNTVCAMIISLLTGLTLGSGPLASAICNKYGCRTTTIIGALIAAVGCAISYFATEMWHIVFSVGVIMGVGFGLMYCPAIVIVTMYFEKRRSLATGIAVAGAGVGTVLFSPINEYIISHYGWRAVFLAFEGVLGLCVICGWTFRPLLFRELTEEEEAEDKDSIELVKPKEATIEESAALLTSTQEKAIPKFRELAREAKSLDDITISDGERDDDESGPSSGPNRPKVSTATAVLEYVILARDSFLMSSPPSAWRKRSETVGERHVGYINRKDVFYTGSITNVAEFKEHPHRYRSTGSLQRRPLSGALSVSVEKLQEVRETSEEVSEDTTTDNVEGSHMFKTISRMLSLSLLIDPTFLVFAISNLLTSVGFNSPLYFLPLHAMKGVGLDSASSSRVLSVFGMCNTLGRVVFGVVADHRLPLPYGLGEDTARNRLWMYNISLSLCGILTSLCYLFTSFVSLSVYAGLFGFSISSYICLTSVILVDLLGLDKLTNAFGLLLLWQGVGTVFGPPISGYLADITHSYVWSFVFCGANLLVSGLMLFTIPYFRKRHAKNQAHARDSRKQLK